MDAISALVDVLASGRLTARQDVLPSPVPATTEFPAADILNRCGRAVPAGTLALGRTQTDGVNHVTEAKRVNRQELQKAGTVAPNTGGLWPGGRVLMPTIDQCRTYAANYKILGADPANSARRSAVLTSISRSWVALGNQLETLALIVGEEG